jgi:LysR family glycine cleavage system transcriptional activator
VLTYRGEYFARETQRALGILNEARRFTDAQEIAGRLCVSCTPGFATYWLCHQIGKFQRAHPQVELNLVSPRIPDDVSNRDVDLFIAYGVGDWPDLRVELIATLDTFPVCSPSLLNAAGGLDSPEDLANLPLLHMVDHSDWLLWAAAAGVRDLNVRNGIVFSDAHLVQSAAIAGQGVAMGDALVSGDAMAKGQLVRLFNVSIEPPNRYYFVTDAAKSERPDVQAFKAWMKAELRLSEQFRKGSRGGVIGEGI